MAVLRMIRTHRIMRWRHFEGSVKTGPNFTAEAAEAEIERLSCGSKKVVWNSPTRQTFEFDLPATVYPPREDTSLLAGALHRLGLPHGSSCLEIGCGSGAVSIHAATLGWRVVACDINPFSVACTRHHASLYGQTITVLEGGPGPLMDGFSAQWGGDRRYDVVMWNLPYLPRPDEGEEVLGPMEESALIDTDDKGLFVRYVNRISKGQLLKENGIALAVVSSLLDGASACSIAWRNGLAARVIATENFEDGETLFLVGMWIPYANSQKLHESVVESTNTVLLEGSHSAGVRCTADRQLLGRGRRGRSWESFEGGIAVSWVIDDGTRELHKPADQVHLGFNMLQLFQHYDSQRICLKWPNDIYIRSSLKSPWKKCAGILFEGRTRGKGQRTVLGIGLNQTQPKRPEFSGLDELSTELGRCEIVGQLHAIIASMFEFCQQPHIPFSNPQIDNVNEALVFGAKQLGPVFYRGSKVDILGIDADGHLNVLDAKGTPIKVKEPEDLEWSNI